MTTSLPKTSVWSLMNYPPPKGRCNHKASLMSPACPCLRFMLHPVKAATSFECDGCAHHASFHSLENPGEDAIVARWEAQEAARRAQAAANRVETQGSAKRKRIADKPPESMAGVFEIVDVTEEVEAGGEMEDLTGAGGTSRVRKARAKKT